MTRRTSQNNKKQFEETLHESMNESFSILLDQSSMNSFFSYLEKSHGFDEKNVGQNLGVFSSELHKFFGVNAEKVEKLIVALLYSKLGSEYKERDDYEFTDYITYARSLGVKHAGVPDTRRLLKQRDLRVIKALGEDARKTITQIAEETGLSRPTVTNMINRMVEEGVLHLKAGVSLQELGFPTAFLALECRQIDQRMELQRNLASCPRVLMILEPSEKVNMLLLVYGEDQVTLKSTIESFRHFSGANLVEIYHSGPPMVPQSFNIPIFTEKDDVSPCDRKCFECVNYVNEVCFGCPAVKEYKGPL
jgi:Lrp/AsnC family leucine-responsive transcriptional regulator